MIPEFRPVDLVVQAARFDPPPHLVRVVLQADIENSAPLKHMLACDRSSSREGNCLRQPQRGLSGAPIGYDRADIAPGEGVAEQPLARLDKPVVQSRIP